jgi:hypothetical protein
MASSATSPLGLSRLLLSRLPSGTRMALTTPPAVNAWSNTLTVLPATAALTSSSSSPNRTSGLSLPYLPMASAYVMRRKGVARSTPLTCLNMALTSPSMVPRMPSWSVQAISRSSCVNSGCRSARRSSSRKQRAICVCVGGWGGGGARGKPAGSGRWRG